MFTIVVLLMKTNWVFLEVIIYVKAFNFYLYENVWNKIATWCQDLELQPWQYLLFKALYTIFSVIFSLPRSFGWDVPGAEIICKA